MGRIPVPEGNDIEDVGEVIAFVLVGLGAEVCACKAALLWGFVVVVVDPTLILEVGIGFDEVMEDRRAEELEFFQKSSYVLGGFCPPIDDEAPEPPPPPPLPAPFTPPAPPPAEVPDREEVGLIAGWFFRIPPQLFFEETLGETDAVTTGDMEAELVKLGWDCVEKGD